MPQQRYYFFAFDSVFDESIEEYAPILVVQIVDFFCKLAAINAINFFIQILEMIFNDWVVANRHIVVDLGILHSIIPKFAANEHWFASHFAISPINRSDTGSMNVIENLLMC